MGYVIAGVLVVLIIAGLILFLVGNSMKKSNVSDDDTPAGDTDQHSDTVSEPGSAERFDRPADRPDVARPVVGGEAEGERSAP
jgi:predicted lipid-binding transport protein (Tim44 family)